MIVNQPMSKIRSILFCLLLAFFRFERARGGTPIRLSGDTATDQVSADLHGEPLWPLLEDIAHQTGWHIFVEPDMDRNSSAKFKDLPVSDALKMLLGNLNFAIVPQTNAPTHLYVFRTVMRRTRQSR